ncbi:hypothetical protein BDY24DRAFT_379359 [Mrakia frigida]|uniref:uncharacterized protein n=1 Tax=Mrakia frigida TaxID=29902 RepID=UPI003FCC094D
MAYRSKLANRPSPSSSPTRSSFFPPSTDSLFSSFPGSSPFPAPRQRTSSTPSTSSSSATQATIRDLPTEIVLAISSYLYLPPTEYSSSHERNLDLRSLGLAGGKGIQAVVRAVLFEETYCSTEKEVRWLLGRKELMGLIRSFTLQTPPLALHLHLLLLHLRNISSLTLNCKLTTVTTQKLLLPLLPQSLPNLLSLNLAFAEDVRPALVGSIAERLPTSLERLGLSTIFMDGGLLAEVVMWEENEINAVLLLLSQRVPSLTSLSLPLHLLPPVTLDLVLVDDTLDPSSDPLLSLEPYRRKWGDRSRALFGFRLKRVKFGGWEQRWDA